MQGWDNYYEQVIIQKSRILPTQAIGIYTLNLNYMHKDIYLLHMENIKCFSRIDDSTII